MKLVLSVAEGVVDLLGTCTVTAEPTPANVVESVNFYVDDDVVVSTDTSHPFTFAWDTTTVSTGPHQLRAKAFYPKRQIVETKLDVTVAEQQSPPSPPLPSVSDPIVEPLVQDIPVLMEIEE